jgi:hypothetical protein
MSLQLIAVVALLACFAAVALLDRHRRRRDGGQVLHRHNGTVMFACDQCPAYVTGLRRREALAWARDHAASYHAAVRR